MNERLDFLVRKNKGKNNLKSHQQFFKGFNLKKLEYIDLEESDTLLSKVRSVFKLLESKIELIENNEKSNSVLIAEKLSLVQPNDCCFVFTDDVYTCGMFKATAQSVLKNCLDVAFLAYDNTCSLIDSEFKFAFTINYSDENNNYDIQLKEI